MADHSSIRVKFVARGISTTQHAGWLRMFPSRIPQWGRCVFLFDPEETAYDWLVVYNDLPRKNRLALHCLQQNTLFITSEPSSISTYGRNFLDQFGYVLTGQEDWAITHPGKIHSQPALRWFYGDSIQRENMLDYDFMIAHPPKQKARCISTVCSTKAQRHTMHYQRIRFVEKTLAALPELEWFGRGIREMDDKSEALDNYRYHIAIENHVCDHWWTEKLSDAFLGLTLPFYFGAPNAAAYFPEDSFIPINIFNFEESFSTMKDAIANHEYEKRLPAIREARRRVLQQYNPFAVISGLIEERYSPSGRASPGNYIYTRRALRRHPARAIRAGIEKISTRMQSRFHQRSIKS